MLNYIPIIGWPIDLILKMSLALPFWIVWTNFGIGEEFFPFLPAIYLHPGFWNCVGIFIAVPIIYNIFVPKLASVTQTNNEKKD